MSWAQDQRQTFIRNHLLACGELNKLDIQQKFGISPRTAQNDIAAYIDSGMKPQMRYDPKRKMYRRAEEGRRHAAR